MSFWGCVVEPKKEAAFVPPPDAERLHVSQACLAPGSSKGAHVTVLLKVADGSPLAITSLREGKMDSTALDLVLDSYAEFSVHGTGAVHLTGYYIPAYDLEEEESEEDMGDDMENLIEGLGFPDDLEYISDEDSDYSESEDGTEFDSAEEDLDSDDLMNTRSDVSIEDITDKETETSSQNGLKEAKEKKKLPGGTIDNEESDLSEDSVSASDDIDGSDTSESDIEQESDELSTDDSSSDREDKSHQEKQLEKQKGSNGVTASKPPAKRKAEPQETPAGKSTKKVNVSSTVVGKDLEMKKSSKQIAAEKNKNTAKSRVKRWPNGFSIEELEIGRPDGKLAKPGKRVSVRYTGKLESGKIFDSTKGARGFTFRLGVGEVVKGFDRGVEGMRVGDKRRVTIPPQMGYGSNRTGPIPPNSTLIFDLELLDVKQ